MTEEEWSEIERKVEKFLLQLKGNQFTVSYGAHILTGMMQNFYTMGKVHEREDL